MCKSAAEYYCEGYNCCQCILKAANDKYNLNLSEKEISSCSAVNNGFGTGGICCVIVAAIMVFGMLFDEDKTKILRMRLLNEFHMKYGNINCGRMKGYSMSANGCEEVINNVWNIMTQIIDENLK